MHAAKALEAPAVNLDEDKSTLRDMANTSKNSSRTRGRSRMHLELRSG